MFRNGILFMAFIFITGLTGVHAQEFEKKGQAEIEFNKQVHNFGEVPQGEPASYEFEVKNTGDGPLLIKDVNPSCGCTTPSWPKKPIQPGETAKIEAQYDAKSMGSFNKSIHVKTNVPFSGKKTLRIKGTVIKSDQGS